MGGEYICVNSLEHVLRDFWPTLDISLVLVDFIVCELALSVRGDYDYCQVPGTRQLSPVEVGEDNSKFEPRKLRKNQIHQYGKAKGCYRGL